MQFANRLSNACIPNTCIINVYTYIYDIDNNNNNNTN